MRPQVSPFPVVLSRGRRRSVRDLLVIAVLTAHYTLVRKPDAASCIVARSVRDAHAGGHRVWRKSPRTYLVPSLLCDTRSHGSLGLWVDMKSSSPGFLCSKKGYRDFLALLYRPKSIEREDKDSLLESGNFIRQDSEGQFTLYQIAMDCWKEISMWKLRCFYNMTTVPSFLK